MSRELLAGWRSDGDEVYPGEVAPQPRAFVKIWIDLDNTPHVPFFRPIIRELESLGFRVVVTARDAFQVCDLAAQMGVSCKKVGRHYGRNRWLKVWGLGWRSGQLLPFLLKERPALALSHGARSQILLSNLLRVPTVMIMDYEFAKTPALLRPRWEIVPAVLWNENLQCKNKARIRTYRGIKEDVYAPGFQPDDSLRKQLGLADGELVVTVRPPANEAHYHNPESERFFERFMDRACSSPGTRTILLPRNKSQEAQWREQRADWFRGPNVIVPQRAVDGLNLLWHSDLVVSGGGTMNREAAALGVPVYSIFRGKIGAVDRRLQAEGRLTLIERLEDVDGIPLRPRRKLARPDGQPRDALKDILAHVQEILRLETHGSKN